MTHKTIVVANRKGGVGKTTVSTHIAAGLAMLGFRVALIDTDPQGHCATAFGLPKMDGLYNIVTDPRAKFSDNMLAVPAESYAVPGWNIDPANLSLLPGHRLTARLAVEITNPFRLKKHITRLAKLLNLEYVIIDTGPTISLFNGSIMMAADYYVFVTEVAMLSFDGLMDNMAELDEMNADADDYRDSPIELLGIVPNKMRANTNNHRDNIKTLAGQFPGKILTPITLRTVWETAFEYGQLVYSYSPYDVEFNDAWNLVDAVLKRLGELPTNSTFVKDILKENKVNALA